MRMRVTKFLLACIPIAIALFPILGCEGTSRTTPPESLVSSPSGPKSVEKKVKIFLLRGEEMTPVERASKQSGVEAALEELLSGPRASEEKAGITTSIPAGTKLLSYRLEDDTAKADFSREILSYGGGSAIVQAITGQIEKTILANDENVRKVEIFVGGEPAEEALQP
ncbi:MAG: GerMN domain-containing protein [Actinomycetota bacterium]|nr:GerMN domain-containing protein [Actinomycetota bacterium]